MRSFWLLCSFLTPCFGMKWGVSTSAYQIEGAYKTDGKGLSVWDTFSHQSGTIVDGSNGDIGPDHYHHLDEDIGFMQDLGIQSYRFSLSWPRLLPQGTDEMVNEMGVKFYEEILDKLEEKGIEPLVTLWHWDTPQTLQDAYGGWENDQMIEDFVDYARVCFSLFGDRVERWITLNEPLTVAQLGYGTGTHAPGKKDTNRLPYEVGHRMIKAHAKVYKMYHEEFSEQMGKISIALNSDFVYPASDNPKDKNAAERAVLWRMGWFADPIFFGDYPAEMKDRCQHRLPSFQTEDDIIGTLDFFSLNHYTSLVGSNSPNNDPNLFLDPQVSYQFPLLSEPSASSWLRSYPMGIADMIIWIQERYDLVGKKMSLIISESGVSTYPNVLEDQSRIDYIINYHRWVENVNILFPDLDISHYCIWSLLDNFEWAAGYTERFGLIDIDFQDPERKRTYKDSAFYLKETIAQN